MSTQGSGPLVPGIAVGAGDFGQERETVSSTDDGVPVGAADAAEDAKRSGADVDEAMATPVHAAMPDVDDTPDEVDDGVPVGRADAEADRQRTTSD
jgi:hypothetical protein